MVGFATNATTLDILQNYNNLSLYPQLASQWVTVFNTAATFKQFFVTAPCTYQFNATGSNILLQNQTAKSLSTAYDAIP